MKKIRNIGDLQHEQYELRQRDLQLEKEMRRDWNDLKHMFLVQSHSFTGEIKKAIAAKLVLRTISFVTGLLAGKFGEKIGSKIYRWFK